MKILSVALLSFGLIGSCELLFGQESADKVFTDIYDKGAWSRDQDGKGVSGKGSLVKNTKPYMKFLKKFLVENDIRSVIDAGCGDWTFSQHVVWGNIQYIGYDAVKQVIKKNQEKFSSPSVVFIHGDVTQIDLPPADLLICKDVLMYLPLEDISLFVKQIHKYKYCLITNDVDSWMFSLSSDNRQVERGGYRTLDLTKPPFNVSGAKVLTYRADDVVKQVLAIYREPKVIKRKESLNIEKGSIN